MHVAGKLGVIIVMGGFVAGAAAVGAQAPAKKAGGKPRVFFIEPKNGATVTSPVHMKFGAENIEIAAVPQGDVTTARPGIGHYHVGIDTGCLPPGQTIVKGTPSWVHFGDGKSEFDVQFTPGKHRVALQLGDDLHKTMPNTCTSITINVAK
jgi:hypothetical protein